MSRVVQCLKLGKSCEGLAYAPYPGALGQRIFEHISVEAWALWQKQQTMLINEHRLNASDPQARAFLAQAMKAFLFDEPAS